MSKYVAQTAFLVSAIGLMQPHVVVAGEVEVGQKDKTFVQNGNPVESLSISKGDTVKFRNHDPFFHNVFSLSDAKTFDLGSYPAGQHRDVVFDAPGTIEVECAIHPQMFLKIDVK